MTQHNCIAHGIWHGGPFCPRCLDQEPSKGEQAARIAQLEAEVAGLRKDAERYRFLRADHDTYGVRIVCIEYWSDEYPSTAGVTCLTASEMDGDIDRAIDKARGEK